MGDRSQRGADDQARGRSARSRRRRARWAAPRRTRWRTRSSATSTSRRAGWAVRGAPRTGCTRRRRARWRRRWRRTCPRGPVAGLGLLHRRPRSSRTPVVRLDALAASALSHGRTHACGVGRGAHHCDARRARRMHEAALPASTPPMATTGTRPPRQIAASPSSPIGDDGIGLARRRPHRSGAEVPGARAPAPPRPRRRRRRSCPAAGPRPRLAPHRGRSARGARRRRCSAAPPRRRR